MASSSSSVRSIRRRCTCTRSIMISATCSGGKPDSRGLLIRCDWYFAWVVEKRMEAFAVLFLMVSFRKIGTSAIQSRATAGVANSTYIFCLPGSPGACKDAWDEILVYQLDYRHGPCNFVEIMPRLDEHLRRPKARGSTV